MKFPSCFILLLSLALLRGIPAPAAENSARGQDFFQKQVQPVLDEYCWDCHADGMDKGHILLDKFKTYGDSLNDKKFWDDIREHVSTHVMPPTNKPQPTEAQRETLLNWIDDSVMWVDPAKPDPGHITLRRLNRSQYNNTVRDIFFVDTKPASQFPSDDTGYGFDNIGDVLSLSPMLMEKYLRAAKKIAEEAVWIKEPQRTEFEMIHEEFEVTSGRGSTDKEGAAFLYTNGELSAKFHVERYANWRFVLTLAAQQCGKENARYAVLIDGKQVAEGEVIKDYGPDPEWQRVCIEVKLGGGKHRLAVRFLNKAEDPTNPDPKRRDRNLALHGVSVVGPIGFEDETRSKFVDWLVEGAKFTLPTMRLDGEDFETSPNSGVNYGGFACIYCNGSIHRQIYVPKAGEYNFHIYATEDHAGSEFSKMGVKVDDQDWGIFDVGSAKGGATEVAHKMNLKAGPHEMSISFLNDAKVGKDDRNLFVHNVVVESPPEKLVDPRSPEFTHNWITRLGVRAFRRPLTEDELQRFTKLAKIAYDSGDNLAGAAGLVTEAILCSSNFLFCGGARPEGPVDKNTVAIDEFSLASRLSYFLWSSCPDEQLLALAQNGELRKHLPEQVHRMIGDGKASAFTENFAGQWLQLRDMTLVAPDTKRFTEFNGRLAADMQRESQMYFDNIFKNNRSVLEFLDSDYTFANARLAKFYGLPDVKGNDFQKVSLAGTPRGGILTQGSILTLTSHPNRTSPVKRGKFLLENILGTPPPPPPQNVPPLPEDHRGNRVKGTLRQRLEIHRSNPTCASCHAFLDPMGLAFEHFDAIGRFRDQDNGEKIDASGQLISGQKFDGVTELRKLLVDVKKKQFTQCLAENLLVFALGRGLDYPDKPFKDEIVRRAGQDEYRFQDMIMGVVESIPFQRMRADEVKKEKVASEGK